MLVALDKHAYSKDSMAQELRLQPCHTKAVVDYLERYGADSQEAR